MLAFLLGYSIEKVNMPAHMGYLKARDPLLAAAAADGEARCRNAAQIGSAVILPPDRDADWGPGMIARQQAALKPSQLRQQYLILLKYADDLLYFINANVGVSQEFPVVISAENRAAMDAYEQQLIGLRAAVGCLTEL